MVELFEQVTAVIEASDGPITCGPYDLADGAVVSSSECKWFGLCYLSKERTDDSSVYAT